jgi:acetolactate synthase-1/2/3 large subunit
MQGKPEYGSDIVVDILKSLGIEYAAMNPGASFRGIHDSLVNYGGNTEPEIILCNHEQVAVAIAHGYSMASGRPMAAIIHNIVGLLNAANPIYGAWLARVPVYILGGGGPMAQEKRRPWVDWVHTALVQGNAVRDFVKWDDQPNTLPGLVDSMIRAYQISMTEPQGPTYICIDAELQEQRNR